MAKRAIIASVSARLSGDRLGWNRVPWQRHNARAQPRGPATTCTPLAEPPASTRGSKMLPGPVGCSALLWGVAAKLTTTPDPSPRGPPPATNTPNLPAPDGPPTPADPGPPPAEQPT